MADFRASIPGWLESVESEGQSHERAFAHPHDDICGIPVRHISLSDVSVLRQMGNKLVGSDFPGIVEFVSFPWIHSDVYAFLNYMHVNRSSKPIVNMYRRFKYRRLNKSKLYREICRYLSDTYIDSLGSFEDDGRQKINFWYSSVEYVDMIAQEYGWTDEYILNMPYRRVIQYARKIIKRKNPKTPISSVSDRVLVRHMEQMNAN